MEYALTFIQWNSPDHNAPLLAADCKDHPAVRPATYLDVFELIGTAGHAKETSEYTFEVMGILESDHGKLVVAPGDWIATFIPGVHIVLSDAEYQNH